ncbi:MAG TPA: hypothetical protein VK403_07180 [Allosphingosinicella sp.]|nr:hypothetical protein [Allosphingosinicella sp.]
MESNERYYARRAVEELRAAERALTPEGKARRRALAEAFQLKARQCGRESMVTPSEFESAAC